MKKELALAQDLMWTAFDTHSKAKRIELSRQALEICPECADAYVLLADDLIADRKERIAFLEEGVRAGRRALGTSYFKEDVGHFWGILETRPYMRALFSLAHQLYEDGQVDAAIEHFRELMRLNPNDNQGVRYVLVPLFVSLRKFVDARKLLDMYKEDTGVWITYSRALLHFKQRGDTKGSRAALYEAIRCNRKVIDFLLLKSFDRKAPLPGSYSPGGEDEAFIYVKEWGWDWQKSKAALQWILESLVALVQEKT